jgi:2-polyprenyl-3-methyl-5-hydroxy-6-metoxy-1,4-benzoquinol methylase
MGSDKIRQEDTKVAQQYFGSFAQDYQRAVTGIAKSPLHELVNRLFRRKTFLERTRIVRDILQKHGIAGKRVLDLGCGSGEVSITAAELGAYVIGIDIVEDMVELARQQAQKAGLADKTEFEVRDIFSSALPTVDAAMLIGVIEYYQNIEDLLSAVTNATSELVIIVDTYGPWWRRQLRYLLAKLKNFRIYYRSPQAVTAVMMKHGFTAQPPITGHSFIILTYTRNRVDA